MDAAKLSARDVSVQLYTFDTAAFVYIYYLFSYPIKKSGLESGFLNESNVFSVEIVICVSNL